MNPSVDSRKFDPEIVQQLGRIDLIANVIVDGVRHGLHRSRRRGFSTEFSDFKPYTPGDETRLLDWRVYARTDRLFVKCFEAETSLELALLLDASKSMAWRWQQCLSKLEYATNLTAALACLHMKQQDQVGLLVHDARRLHFLPPRCRKAQLEEIFAVLERVTPGSADTFPALVRGLAETKRHRGMVIACSDLEEDENDLRHALRMLARTDNDVVLFHVLDRAEIELPFTDATHLRDSETAAVIPVNLRLFREEYQESVDKFRAGWRDECEANGILYVPVDTGTNYVDAVCAMLTAHEQQRQRAPGTHLSGRGSPS